MSSFFSSGIPFLFPDSTLVTHPKSQINCDSDVVTRPVGVLFDEHETLSMFGSALGARGERHQASAWARMGYKSWGSFDVSLHREIPASSTLRDVPLQTVCGTHRCHLFSHIR